MIGVYLVGYRLAIQHPQNLTDDGKTVNFKELLLPPTGWRKYWFVVRRKPHTEAPDCPCGLHN